MMAIVQHDEKPSTHVVGEYFADSLGAPFTVVLKDSVKVYFDEETGEKRVQIPDLIGLISEIIRTRVSHPRKLSGEEIRFIRKGLGVKSKSLAAFLEVSPEHFSRCEAGSKVLSSRDERMLRLFSFMGTLYKDPQEALDRVGDQPEPEKKSTNPDAELPDFLWKFLNMKIQVMYDPSEKLAFEFCRKINDESPLTSSDDDHWITQPTMAA